MRTGEKHGQGKPDHQVGEKNGAAGDAVEFDRVDAREDVSGDAADGDGLPRTDDEVGESHHPAGGEAGGAGKDGGGVGDLAGGVRHGNDEPAVDPSDGKQESATDGESEEGAQRAAAQQPVVHDDEPADADHGAPSQSEVVGGAQFAGESGQEGSIAIDEERREL